MFFLFLVQLSLQNIYFGLTPKLEKKTAFLGLNFPPKNMQEKNHQNKGKSNKEYGKISPYSSGKHKSVEEARS